MGWGTGFVAVIELVDDVVVIADAVLAPAAMLRLASMRAAMVLRALFIEWSFAGWYALSVRDCPR